MARLLFFYFQEIQAMNPSEWFTEQAAGAGSAFSLKIKRKLHEEQ